MYELRYLRFSKYELEIVFTAILTLSLLFSFSYTRFSVETSFIGMFIGMFFFLSALLGGRFLFMKIVAVSYAFELKLEKHYFDQFWFGPWNRLTYIFGGRHSEGFVAAFVKFISKEKSIEFFKGIPMSVFSILLYVITLGFFIYPNLWRFTCTKIPHLHLGRRLKWEYGITLPHMEVIEITQYRMALTVFWGIVYYFLFGLIISLFFRNSEMYTFFLFVIFYIGFISLFPLISSEGNELLVAGKFYMWVAALIVLIWGVIALLLIDDIITTLIVTFFCSVLSLGVVFIRRVMGSGGGH